MKTLWLSFADGTKPKGSQFLGVAVVEVSDAEATAALVQVRINFPRAKPGAEWVAAASRKAWMRGCNPGGQVLSVELSPEHADGIPRNRLLTREELEHFGERLTEGSHES